MKDVVYAFEFCSCIYESGYSTMSLHRTKKGAYNAMRKYLLYEYNQWHDDRTFFGKNKRFGEKFGVHQSWGVSKIDLQP